MPPARQERTERRVLVLTPTPTTTTTPPFPPHSGLELAAAEAAPAGIEANNGGQVHSRSARRGYNLLQTCLELYPEESAHPLQTPATRVLADPLHLVPAAPSRMKTELMKEKFDGLNSNERKRCREDGEKNESKKRHRKDGKGMVEVKNEKSQRKDHHHHSSDNRSSKKDAVLDASCCPKADANCCLKAVKGCCVQRTQGPCAAVPQRPASTQPTQRLIPVRGKGLEKHESKHNEEEENKQRKRNKDLDCYQSSSGGLENKSDEWSPHVDMELGLDRWNPQVKKHDMEWGYRGDKSQVSDFAEVDNMKKSTELEKSPTPTLSEVENSTKYDSRVYKKLKIASDLKVRKPSRTQFQGTVPSIQRGQEFPFPSNIQRGQW